MGARFDLLAGRGSGAYASVEAYLAYMRARMSTVNYYAAAGGEKAANVLDTRVAFLEKDGELSGLAPKGALELYDYLIETKIDVSLEDVSLVGGMYAAEDGWCDLEGQGGHSLIVLRYADGSVDALFDRFNNDDRGGLYHYEENAEELLYDWYVRAYGLDLPLCTVDLLPAGENGSCPAHRRDGDGWYLYVPISGWYEAGGGDAARWMSQYGTGSTLTVTHLASRDENALAWQSRPAGADPNTLAYERDGVFTAVYLHDDPSGGCWQALIQYDAKQLTDYPEIAREPRLLEAMARTFTPDGRFAAAARQDDGGWQPLTADEVAAWAEALRSEDGRPDETGGYAVTTTIVSCFFTSHYSDPRDIDLAEFLAYAFPLDEAMEDETEFAAINARAGFEHMDEDGTIRAATLEEMPVPVHRYRASAVNAALTEYAGVTLDDLSTDWRGDGRVLYLPEYDAFYNFTSDFGPGFFAPESGEALDGVVRLNSRSDVLTVRGTPDNFQILSFTGR